MWKSTGPQKGKPDGMGLRKGAILQPARPGRAFKGLGGAKRYCRKDSIGDNFAQGAMTKYWVFTQGGAWRNLKPTGTAYVCEQIRLDARSGNDSTLTMQAVTAIELAPTDVCTDCGARLLKEAEAQDRA